MPDNVNHPQHYGGDTPYEVIKVLRAWMTQEALHGFCLANTIKYVARAGKKSGESIVEPLKKARWYLDWVIKDLEERGEK